MDAEADAEIICQFIQSRGSESEPIEVGRSQMESGGASAAEMAFLSANANECVEDLATGNRQINATPENAEIDYENNESVIDTFSGTLAFNNVVSRKRNNNK